MFCFEGIKEKEIEVHKKVKFKGGAKGLQT